MARALMTRSGTIIKCNESFCELLNMEEKEVLNANISCFARYDSPADLLESLHSLQGLDANSAWREKLSHNGKDQMGQEYLLVAKLSKHMAQSDKLLDVIIKETEHSEKKRQRISTLSSASFNFGSFSRDFSLSMSSDEFSPSSILRSISVSMNILIADPSPTTRRIVSRSLSSLGHTVTYANNGIEALDFLTTKRFDLAFVELRLQGISGSSVISTYRQLENDPKARSCVKGQKIVAMTDDIHCSFFCEVGRAGVDSFLHKPLTEEKLLEALNTPCLLD